MTFNPSDRTPDMSIDISLGEFHRIHEEAKEASRLVAKGMSNLFIHELRDILSKLEAGQRLSDAETGPDFMFASSYSDQIRFVKMELEERYREI